MGELAIVAKTDEQQPVQRHPGGRPTLYSDAVKEVICDKIRKGIRAEAAALAVGITRETFCDWMRDKEEFSYAVLRADAEAEGTYTESMHAAAIGTQGQADWKAAESWLKRRRRAAYGDTLSIKDMPLDKLYQIWQAQQQAASAITEDGQPALLPGDDLL